MKKFIKTQLPKSWNLEILIFVFSIFFDLYLDNSFTGKPDIVSNAAKKLELAISFIKYCVLPIDKNLIKQTIRRSV